MTELKNIYLDYAATTPVDPRVAEQMTRYLTLDGIFGNPASRSHKFGWQAEEAVENARSQLADLIGADVREIIFTSGATEANNLALKGLARFRKHDGRHIITCATEHKSVLDPCRYLEREGFEVTYLRPQKTGLIDPEQVREALKKETILVSIMYVNNELGVIQPIQEIGALCQAHGATFHVDAAQALGKLAFNIRELPVDLMSFSAHKVYGPKGVGALYVRRKPRVRLEALLHGGGHERGLRSGTLPVHQIVGMGEACRLAQIEGAADYARAASFRQRLCDGLRTLEAVTFNGLHEASVPHIVNVSFAYVEGESLMMALKGLAVSSGSACTSATLEPSYVLRALGLPDELAHSSIRFSWGRFTKHEEIDATTVRLRKALEHLRNMSPLWEMHLQGIDPNQVTWASHA